MRFQLALFDWDGTLLDNIHLVHAASSHTFRTLAPEKPIPTLEEFRDRFSAAQVMEYYYQNGIPRTVTKDELYALWESHYDPTCAEIGFRLHKGAVRLLHALNAYQVRKGVVSAARESTLGHLKSMMIAHYFEHIRFCAFDKEVAIREMLDLYNVFPYHAFYVDDTVDGLLQAKRAGVTTIGFTEGQNNERVIRSANPDHVVSSLMEILEIFRTNIT